MSVKLELETDSELEIDVASMLQDVQEFTQNDVQILLIKTNNSSLASVNPSYERKLWGRSMLDWVRLGLGSPAILVEDGPVLEVIRPHLEDKPVTLVAFADTPLFTPDLIGHMLRIVNSNFGQIHNFGRAFMGATKLFKSAKELPSVVDYHFKDLIFMLRVDNFVALAQAEDELRERIIYSHLKNGVHFLDRSSVQIDVDVKIGKNVEIGMSNILKGKTTIGDNVVLGIGNVVENCEIGDSVTLNYCVMKNSKLGANSVIKPYSVIENGKLIGGEK